MARRKQRTSKKRTISAEQLVKMREGKERAKRHRERLAATAELNHRLRKAARGY